MRSVSFAKKPVVFPNFPVVKLQQVTSRSFLFTSLEDKDFRAGWPQSTLIKYPQCFVATAGSKNIAVEVVLAAMKGPLIVEPGPAPKR